jgi:hypothetical protein
MSGTPKCYFAAIPARAFYDRRLDGGRFQLLGAIALSNRLGRGQGCWKSAASLAGLTGLDPGTIRNYIGDLTKWKYVIREPRPGTKAQRSLFVVYDQQADREALTRAKCHPRMTPRGAKVSSEGGQSVISRNDTSERREREIAQSARERNSAEAGPRPKDAHHDVQQVEVSSSKEGKFLRQLQGWLKAETRQSHTRAEVVAMRGWMERIDEIWEGTDLADPINGWARGLGDELHAILENYPEEDE